MRSALLTPLMENAIQRVPAPSRAATPLAFRATAGFRLLGRRKAEELLTLSCRVGFFMFDPRGLGKTVEKLSFPKNGSQPLWFGAHAKAVGVEQRGSRSVSWWGTMVSRMVVWRWVFFNDVPIAAVGFLHIFVLKDWWMSSHEARVRETVGVSCSGDDGGWWRFTSVDSIPAAGPAGDWFPHFEPWFATCRINNPSRSDLVPRQWIACWAGCRQIAQTLGLGATLGPGYVRWGDQLRDSSLVLPTRLLTHCSILEGDQNWMVHQNFRTAMTILEAWS